MAEGRKGKAPEEARVADQRDVVGTPVGQYEHYVAATVRLYPMPESLALQIAQGSDFGRMAADQVSQFAHNLAEALVREGMRRA